MTEQNDENLIAKAISVLNPRTLSKYQAEAAGVGSALITDKGNIYTGVFIDISSGIGFCAEHSAIAAMITAGESKINTIVAINWDKTVLPPCGRCREFIWQVHDDNRKTRVILPNNKILTLNELLPFHWCDKI